MMSTARYTMIDERYSPSSFAERVTETVLMVVAVSFKRTIKQ